MNLQELTATTLQSAQANTLASVTAQVAALNQNRKAFYLNIQFPNYIAPILDGRPVVGDPPKPPVGYVVGYFDDPTTGPGSEGPYQGAPVRWAYPALGTDPVCEMPPVPGVVTHASGTGLIGNTVKDGGGEWFVALKGDTTAVGAVIPGTSLDGVSGLFKRFGAPVGTGWYQKIG